MGGGGALYVLLDDMWFSDNSLEDLVEYVVAHGIRYFYLDGKYLFEVGVPNKKFTQIADIPSSFLAVGGIEIGSGARIPLWMFGLLY